MFSIYRSIPRLTGCVTLAVLVGAVGCRTAPMVETAMPVQNVMPHELSKVVLPAYTIEPPDILMIDALHIVPRSPYDLRSGDVVRIAVHRHDSDPLKPGDWVEVQVQGIPLKTSTYRIKPGDWLAVRAAGTIPPVETEFQVEANGEIRLRIPEYEPLKDLAGNPTTGELIEVHELGNVKVAGLTLEEAEAAIQAVLKERFADVDVLATLLTEVMAIDGAFEVHRTNEIILPLPYGAVSVSEKNIVEAEKAIGARARSFLYQPTVRVALLNPTPIRGSFLVEVDGTIDLNNPLQAAQAAGGAAGPALEFEGQPGAPAPGAQRALEGQPAMQPPRSLSVAQRFGESGRTVFYKPIFVAGTPVENVGSLIGNQLVEQDYFRDIEVLATLEQPAAKQQIAGEHLVGPDGTVTLGTYGSVPVVGLTLAQAKEAVESYLSQFLEDPEISVDVFAYNSKVYYVVTQGAGLGDGIYRFPITGNETVLDAISQMGGLQQISSKRIWIARPTPEPYKVQVLPVHWEAITAQASPATNYQILPGDRIFIAEDKWIALDTTLAKFTAPLERVMGFSLLGVGTVSRFSGDVLGRGFGGGFGGFGGFGF
jgi:protein involved in polysaccharide export with SLBB domain